MFDLTRCHVGTNVSPEVCEFLKDTSVQIRRQHNSYVTVSAIVRAALAAMHAAAFPVTDFSNEVELKDAIQRRLEGKVNV